jgi:hypothetical protein
VEGYQGLVGRKTTFRLLNKLWTEKYGGRDGDGTRTPSRSVRMSLRDFSWRNNE